MVREPPIDHADGEVIPAALVFEMITSFNAAGDPVMVACCVPAKPPTVPVLVNVFVPRARVEFESDCVKEQ